MLPSSREGDGFDSSTEDEVGLVCGVTRAYGSEMDLGVSSTGTREVVGPATAVDLSGKSTLRIPSWPYLLALSVIGCAKVRPEEVSANR
jgi:hypothetical protein